MGRNLLIRKITKSILFLGAALACIPLVVTLMPVGHNQNRLTEIFFAQPVFAQEAGAFPTDEAGISAYVNVGESIDLAKAKSALRGIQAEGDNYIIGIIELPGLPEEEFPHMYVSSEGWLLAYYSKFAPSSRIFQWYGYEGGTITTTTLQDAIAKICPTIGVNFSQVKGNMGYYHFKYPEACELLIAVEWVAKEIDVDTLTFSVPYNVTLYEGSWAHYNYYVSGSFSSRFYVDGTQLSRLDKKTAVVCNYFEEVQISPDRLHTVELRETFLDEDENEKAGVATVFIYR